MFAVLIIQISTNAGRELALNMQAFLLSAYIVQPKYRCPNTPVYWLNGRTAFVDECDKRRDRFGHLLFLLLCYKTSTFPTLHRLAAAERQPTKRVPLLFASPAIPTLTLPAWAWTCTTATSATDGRPMHKGRRSPARSTSAARATRWEPRRTPGSLNASTPNGWRNRPGTGTCAPRNGCATRWLSSDAIRTRRCFRHICHKENNLPVPTNLPHDGEALGVCRRMVIKPSGGTGRVHTELKTIYQPINSRTL